MFHNLKQAAKPFLFTTINITRCSRSLNCKFIQHHLVYSQYSSINSPLQNHHQRLEFISSQQKEKYERILKLLSYGEVSVGAMDFKGAWKKYQEALQLSEDTFGQEEVETAFSLHKLGDLYQIEGQFSKSLNLYTRAMRIFKNQNHNQELIAALEKSIGLLFKHTEHPSEALDYLLKSAHDWSELEEYENAVQSLKFISEMIDKNLILDSQVISEVHELLGDIYTRVNELELAQENLEKALKLKLENSTEKNPNLGSTYALLGFLYLKENDTQRSLECISKGIHLIQKAKKKNLPILARSFATLGCIEETNEKYEQALEHFQTSYNLFLQILDGQKEDAKIAKVLSYMGNIYFYQNESEKAIECFENCIRIAENLRINDQDFLSTIYNNLGTLYIKLDKNNEANECLNKAISLKEESNVEDDVLDLGHLYRKVGIIYANNLKYQEAKTCFEKAFDAYNKILGEFDIESRTTMTLLTEVKNRMKDLQKIETQIC